MKLKIIYILLLISNACFGQFIYEGKVVDAQTNQPIEGVNLKIAGSDKGVVTDQKGVFKIEVKQLPFLLIISHIGYESEKRNIIAINKKSEIIYLFPKTNFLNEITVLPENQIESISDVEQYSISDFEIIDEQIFRLEYHGAFKKYILSLANFSGDIETSLKLNRIKRIQYLYKSCNGIIYIVSTNHAYPVLNIQDKLELGSKVQIDTFNQFVRPCKLRKDNKLYYLNKQYNGLMSKITTYNIDTEEHRLIRIISNEEQVAHYKEDAQFISKSQKIGNIHTNDIGENERIRNIQENGDFLMTVFYKPEYPVFISSRKDKIVILNHIEKKIEVYNNDILEYEKVINYVLNPDWLKEIIIDEVSEKVYAIFDYKKGIGIEEINLNNGATKLVGILPTAIQNYESIKIHNGIIFYLKENVPNGSIMGLVKYRI